MADGDGVVEVAGGFTVDGDDGQCAEIAALAFLRRDHRGALCASSMTWPRKVVRQMKFADDDFDVDAEVVFAAEDFDDASARILRWRWPVGDFNVYHHAFEILPFGAASGFVAENTIRSILVFFLVTSSAACSSGYSIPGGMTIS